MMSAINLEVAYKNVLWRIHFWAAIVSSPFALIAVLTGMLYLFTPQIERIRYQSIDYVTEGLTRFSVDSMLVSAKKSVPSEWNLHSVQVPAAFNESVKFNFIPPKEVKGVGEHEGHHHGSAKVVEKEKKNRPSFFVPGNAVVVYVDPYTNMVLGRLASADRFNNWAKKLHSRLLQTENWRWMIELAASCLFLMLLTGVILWWSRQGRSGLPNRVDKGRIFWREWHAFLGVALSLISLVILTTGLTWSKYAGDQIRYVRDAVGQAPPAVPRNIKSTVAGETLSWQAVFEEARKIAPLATLQMTPPMNAEGVWFVTNANRKVPTERFELLLDAYSGKNLYYAGWDKQTVFSKATAIGIPFHRGEFGWWNQLLLFLFGAGVLFSLYSGWRMFFVRYQRGLSFFPVVPAGAWRVFSWGSVLTLVALCVLMPVLLVAVLVVICLELAGYFYRR
jgi:uncharacterized iron-regulated membrane protein